MEKNDVKWRGQEGRKRKDFELLEGQSGSAQPCAALRLPALAAAGFLACA